MLRCSKWLSAIPAALIALSLTSAVQAGVTGSTFKVLLLEGYVVQYEGTMQFSVDGTFQADVGGMTHDGIYVESIDGSFIALAAGFLFVGFSLGSEMDIVLGTVFVNGSTPWVVGYRTAAPAG